MNARPVILVHLRRPARHRDDARDDPFYEFGSFGCTRCHRTNLMNPERIAEIAGARLGFAQGGPEGMRLVHLTPPVRVVRHRGFCELIWQPPRMPFWYSCAPTLIANDGATDFPLLKRHIKPVRRGTWAAKFSSKFRSSRRPVPTEIGRQIIRVFEARRRRAAGATIATEYWHTVPSKPRRTLTPSQRAKRLEQLRSAGVAPQVPESRRRPSTGNC